MNRRSFLASSGMFLGIGLLYPSLLLPSNNAISYVFPETKYDLNDRWEFKWTGFKTTPENRRIVGKWIAHPFTKGRFDELRFSCQSTVSMFVPETLASNKYAVIMNFYPSDEAKERIQNGLDTLLELIEKGDNLAIKHKIPGTVPCNSFEGVDRRLLSQHLRRCRKLGIYS